MTEQKNSYVQAIVMGIVLILTLPLIYLFVARVILPMEWSEPQFSESSDGTVSE